jgi:hypothetical protein
MMKLRGPIFFASAAALGLAAVGCGGDDDDTDGMMMMCGGHGQPACANTPWALEKEGGLARAELVQYVDGSHTLGAFAYFFNSQVPAKQVTDGPLIEGTFCQDVRSGIVYDTGPWSQGQAIADTRTYLDMGATVTLENQGAGADYVLNKQTNLPDGSNFIVHDIVYATSTNAVSAEDAAVISKAGQYALKFSGGGWTDADLKNGNSKTHENVAKANMYMPADWTAVSPLDNQALTIASGQDLTFTWTNGTEASGDHAGVLNFVGFGDATVGALDFFCVDDSNSGATDMTIPASVIAQIDAEGWMVHGKATHVGYDIKGFRYDISGVNCHTFGYTKE